MPVRRSGHRRVDRPVVRYTGARSSADEFLWLGEFVAQTRYREMNFSRYKQQRLEAKPTQ